MGQRTRRLFVCMVASSHCHTQIATTCTAPVVGVSTNNMKLILTLISSICLAACDSGVLWERKPYQVLWIDLRDNLTLNHEIGNGASIGRVNEKVVAVGISDAYVVAKRQHLGSESISYYYIEREKDNMYLNAHEITQGPFTEEVFLELKSQLSLPDFSKEFK